jgi:hypothetical protein
MLKIFKFGNCPKNFANFENMPKNLEIVTKIFIKYAQNI